MPAAQASILVVDDVPANLGVLFDALGGSGHRVLVAESGESALALLANPPPDLILLDVQLPGLDGFATYERIKTDARWRATPVIFLTALDAPAEKVRAFAAGAADYVTKPIAPAEVVARVGLQLELRAARRALEERNADLESEIALRLDAEAQLATSLDRAVLVLGPDGAQLFATRLAHALLAKYFPAGAPATLAAGGRHPLGDGALRVRRFTEPGRDDLVMLALEEEHAPPGPAALCALGLTPRQAEVAWWVAQGKTNAETAAILVTSPRTIDKHMEHILARLGFENRAALIVATAELLRPAR